MRIFMFFMAFSLASIAKEVSVPRAEFVGIGEVKSLPDFINVNFTVQSECYQSPQEAQNATDAVVAKIDDYLHQFKDESDEHFKVLVNGGYTSSFSRWHENQEFCRNTFQKSTEITFRIGARDDFNKTFSDLQSYTLKNFTQDVTGAFFDSARTFVRIGMPAPQLTKEHHFTLERQALNLAMLDAKARFKASLESCKSHPWKVLEIKEEGGDEYVAPRSFHFSAKAASAGFVQETNPAPVRFDDLRIEKRLKVSFSFEGALCYEP